MLVTNTSAVSTNSSAVARPSSVARSSTTLRLPRLSSSNGGFVGRSPPSIFANVRAGSPSGGSILTTSAPQSHRIPPAAGPATHSPSSTTRIPSNGPGMVAPLSTVASVCDARELAGETVAGVDVARCRRPSRAIPRHRARMRRMVTRRSLQFALELPTHRADQAAEFVTAEAIADITRTAAAAGFSSVFVTDHPAPDTRWLDGGGHHALDPFVALSFAAAADRGIKLFTNIYVAAYRNPFLSAKSV